MIKRRSNGEGSFWQLSDRTWVHQITIGRKEDGSLLRKSFKGATKKICKQRKEEWLAEQEQITAKQEQQTTEALQISNCPIFRQSPSKRALEVSDRRSVISKFCGVAYFIANCLLYCKL